MLYRWNLNTIKNKTRQCALFQVSPTEVAQNLNFTPNVINKAFYITNHDQTQEQFVNFDKKN